MNQVFRLCGWEGPAFVQATQQVMDRVPVHNTPPACMWSRVSSPAASPRGTGPGGRLQHLQYYWRKHFAYEK
jgi:hypothetical protein